MNFLEQRILDDGIVKPGNVLKVDSFLNHQMDVAFFAEMAKEWKRLFAGCEITKVLTIEASGIGIACMVAQEFGCPLLFAKKNKTKNIFLTSLFITSSYYNNNILLIININLLTIITYPFLMLFHNISSN